MIQRYIYTALVDGIAQITADPTILETLFEDLYELIDGEVEAIKTAFATKPPKVVHGYAPRDIDPPVMAIVLQGETETDTFVGDDGIQIEDVMDPDYGADTKAAIWRHTYNVLIYTEHPDMTTYYYEIAKAILIAAMDYFADRGMFELAFSGEDLLLDPNYYPEYLFARRLTLQASRLFERVNRLSLEGKAFKVGGLHIDKTGSPSDVGGVKTLVTPVSAEDLDE